MSVFNSAEPTQETCKPFVLSRKKPTEPVLSLPNGFAAETLPPRTLTAEQETKLAELRNKIPALLAMPPIHKEDEEWLSDDRCLLRYLRAARWNSTKAAERIQCTLQWRHERRPHRLDPAYVRPEAETGKLTLNGFDRYGHPVIYLVPNRENTKTSQRQVDHFIFFMERAIAAMPSHVDQMTLVIDFTGTSIFQSPGAGVAREIANTLERHYPERLASAFIIGAPWFFGQVYKLISPFLDEVTQKKVQFIDIKIPPPVQSNEVVNKKKAENRKSWLSFSRHSGEAAANHPMRAATMGPTVGQRASTGVSASVSETEEQSGLANTTTQGVPSVIWDIIAPELLDATVGGRMVFHHEMPTYWDHLLSHTVNYVPELPVDIQQ